MPWDNKYNEPAYCPRIKHNLDFVGVEFRPEAEMNPALEEFLEDMESEYSTEFMQYGDWHSVGYKANHEMAEAFSESVRVPLNFN